MSNKTYLTIGKLFFAVAILAIGAVHIVTGHFPGGLLLADPKMPGASALAYTDGAALIIAGLLILSKKYQYAGACLAAVIWLVLTLVLHLPQFIQVYKTGAEWTPTFEVISFFAGALVLMGNNVHNGKGKHKLILTGSYIFGLSILVFAVLHLVYLQFITTLMPAWMPGKLFWAYVVMIAFFAAAISLLIRVWIRLSAALLGLMFFIWFCILHIPLVITHYTVEAQWTSLFVVLASSGVSLIVAGSQTKRVKY